jgi:hypothetical protein
MSSKFILDHQRSQYSIFRIAICSCGMGVLLFAVLSILLPQADTGGPLLLAQQSGLDLEHARRLIKALCNGLTDNLEDERLQETARQVVTFP